MPTVDQYRNDTDELVRLATLDLKVLWRQADDAVVARELLADVLPELTDVYGSASGTVAADWYDELRDEQQIAGRFTAIPGDTPPRVQTDAVARWAVADLFSGEPDFLAALGKAQGSLQRLISNVGRDTLIGSSIADPKAVGWQRVTAGGGCAFCEMLASRGAVYSERTVDFGAHDDCRCSVAPAFDGRRRLVRPYTPSSRSITDADRAATRQWMAEHGY